jgi:hypothetical protein
VRTEEKRRHALGAHAPRSHVAVQLRGRQQEVLVRVRVHALCAVVRRVAEDDVAPVPREPGVRAVSRARERAPQHGLEHLLQEGRARCATEVDGKAVMQVCTKYRLVPTESLLSSAYMSCGTAKSRPTPTGRTC